MSDVLYEKRNHTGILTFNRPSSLNALCESFMKEIRDALENAEKDAELRALILTGCGKHRRRKGISQNPKQVGQYFGVISVTHGALKLHRMVKGKTVSRLLERSAHKLQIKPYARTPCIARGTGGSLNFR